MKPSEIILYLSGLASIAGICYWGYKATTKPPKLEATPEEIEEAFYEAMRHRDFVEAVRQSEALDEEWF